MATYYFNTATQETYDYFKVGQWYKSKLQGIVAKFSGDPYSNDGFWCGEFVSQYFIMVTPTEWEDVDAPDIEKQKDIQNTSVQ